jgi:hypothetical protein
VLDHSIVLILTCVIAYTVYVLASTLHDITDPHTKADQSFYCKLTISAASAYTLVVLQRQAVSSGVWLS